MGRYCSYLLTSMMMEHSKSKSTQPRSASRCPTLYAPTTALLHFLSLPVQYIHDTIHFDPTRPLSRSRSAAKKGNNLLFEYLLLVHAVGDARDGVLVVASVGGHCRCRTGYGYLKIFLVTISVSPHASLDPTICRTWK